MAEIVKVQRPLSPPSGPWLVYGKGGKFTQQFHPTKRVKRALGDAAKAYFNADLYADGWCLGGKVEDQDW